MVRNDSGTRKGGVERSEKVSIIWRASASGNTASFSRRKKQPPVRSLARSIVAWHQSQADFRTGNGAVIQRHDGYVNNVQRFGTVIKIFEMRERTKVRCDDEIAGAKCSRDQFGRVASRLPGFTRRRR